MTVRQHVFCTCFDVNHNVASKIFRTSKTMEHLASINGLHWTNTQKKPLQKWISTVTVSALKNLCRETLYSNMYQYPVDPTLGKYTNTFIGKKHSVVVTACWPELDWSSF